MKINKIIYSPIIPVVLTVVLLVIGFQYENLIFQRKNNNVDSQTISPSTAIVKIEKSETARLKTDGSEFKILTSTYLNTANFIFLDERGETTSTFSVSNPNIEPPYYSIVKGQTRDWLVVTRIGISGTGIMKHINEWYVLRWSGEMKMVLSYPSQGHKAPGLDFNNEYLKTEIINESYADDSAVDVKFIMKDCSITKYGEDKDCIESSRIAHYVWDDDGKEFVFDPKKSDISEQRIDNLL